ncbi:hypothetical protein [Ensifer sp. LCM 4579]|uniref:hypothetical protein n=1 Tax=Ensifer sp. LCM 4579 TaxID=1848292 RepID=UPI0008DA7D08|nr:hypothetical protein [Ensifer sp. LCM 4579]OHV85970.1 hypothetical protein LCM4579_00990 [Ensifer sp. LCM 4579]
MTTNEAILEIVANTSLEEACGFVTEWCNASEVEIDESGNIWIANPMTGHWLDEEKKAQFVAWANAQ